MRDNRGYTVEGNWVEFVGAKQEHAYALRPHRDLLKQSTLALLAFFAPTFAVLYWLTIPSGQWMPVLLSQLGVTLVCGFGLVASYRAFVRVDGAGISERGFFGRHTTFPSASIGSVVLLELYLSGALDTLPQLFVTGHDGRLLLRMRGQFWSRDAMNTVADELGVPIVRVPEPLTLADLNRLRPELLYWFERRPPSRPN